VHGEGGYIAPLQKAPHADVDAIRLTDRFFGPQLRGFDIRGLGPRIQRVPYDADGTLALDKAKITDALGGRAYYMGRLELEFPSNSTLKSVGLRPSAFLDIGSLWDITKPQLQNYSAVCVPKTGIPGGSFILTPGQTCALADSSGTARNPDNYNQVAGGYKELFLGNSPKPRLSIGIGVNWVSPFGPLRLDIAKALLKQPGDETKLFSFNVGTQF
jgi:outer membrane protein insertion porin family